MMSYPYWWKAQAFRNATLYYLLKFNGITPGQKCLPLPEKRVRLDDCRLDVDYYFPADPTEGWGV